MITKENVEDVLLRMGMSVNLKGFHYIRDSVLILDTFEVVEHYIGFINCTNSASLTMLRIRIKEDLKKQDINNMDEATSPLITEKRLNEIMKQSLEEFFTEIVSRLGW